MKTSQKEKRKEKGNELEREKRDKGERGEKEK